MEPELLGDQRCHHDLIGPVRGRHVARGDRDTVLREEQAVDAGHGIRLAHDAEPRRPIGGQRRAGQFERSRHVAHAGKPGDRRGEGRVVVGVRRAHTPAVDGHGEV